MKPFNFSLEKILDLRTYHEDEAKLELGRAIGVLSEIESKIAVIAKERAIALQDQFNPKNSAAVIQQYMFYIIRLDNTKEQLLKEAARAELEVEKAREVFIEASKERKVLDKLKEKRQKEHRKAWLTEEGKALDDIRRKL